MPKFEPIREAGKSMGFRWSLKELKMKIKRKILTNSNQTGKYGKNQAYNYFLSFLRTVVQFWYRVSKPLNCFKGRNNSLIFEKRSKFSFRSGDQVFSHACLLRKKSNSVLSKAGRLAWISQMDGQPVKIYECNNAKHAKFIESVSGHIILKHYFPACLMRNGRYIVVKWIKGKPITCKQVMHDKRILNQIASMQASIHSQSMDILESAGFSYIDFLKNRLERFKGVLPLDQTIQRIYATIANSTALVEQRISHPDLTPINLILEDDTGSLKIIDNELLSQSAYYLIDLFNTYHSFGKRTQNRIIERYLRCYVDYGGDLSILMDHEHYFNTLWYLRLIGSSLQSGAIEKAFLLAQEYVQGNYSKHPLVELVKEIFA